jgi:hypothetical protein
MADEYPPFFLQSGFAVAGCKAALQWQGAKRLCSGRVQSGFAVAGCKAALQWDASCAEELPHSTLRRRFGSVSYLAGEGGILKLGGQGSVFEWYFWASLATRFS